MAERVHWLLETARRAGLPLVAVATAGLPVIVLTGSTTEDSEIAAMENGADDYVRQPLDPPRFVARVKAALRRAGGGG